MSQHKINSATTMNTTILYVGLDVAKLTLQLDLVGKSHVFLTQGVVCFLVNLPRSSMSNSTSHLSKATRHPAARWIIRESKRQKT